MLINVVVVVCGIGITGHGIGISSFSRDQDSPVVNFIGSGTGIKICHAFGISEGIFFFFFGGGGGGGSKSDHR